jgi:hypothetical protein
MTVLATAIALASAAVAATLALRWGAWRWLAVVAAVPALLVGVNASLAEAAAMLGLGAALLLTLWRWPLRQGRVAVALAVLVGSMAALVLSGPGRSELSLRSVGSATAVALSAALVVALAGGAGLGRSRLAPLRWACVLTSAAPLVPLALTGSVSQPAAWWPVAAALGVTGLLRGARGRSGQRPQTDDVDVDALADFEHRYTRLALAPVVVVIAAYNEEDGLGRVLESLPAEVCGLPTDTLVVDDASTDATAEVAEASGAAYVVRCSRNRGQGAALRLGYRVAYQRGASYVITTDADGQYDVADLPHVLAPILEDRADFVTGSRRLGRRPAQEPLRRVGVHVFAFLVSALTGRRLTDTSYGMRAMHAELTGRITLNQPQYQSSELLIGVLSHGYRVLEVPATMHARSAGASKKGRNWVYGRRYAGVVLGTWWREGCPTPVTSCPALRAAARS